MSGGRGAMTMRAQIERSTPQPATPWGQPGPPVFEPLGTVPCRAWSKTRRQIRDDGKEAIVEDMRAVVPASADVKSGDRLIVENRLGDVLFDGPVAVQTVARRGSSASSTGHLELLLTRHL